jgi:hypothetical protein
MLPFLLTPIAKARPVTVYGQERNGCSRLCSGVPAQTKRKSVNLRRSRYELPFAICRTDRSRAIRCKFANRAKHGGVVPKKDTD